VYGGRVMKAAVNDYAITLVLTYKFAHRLSRTPLTFISIVVRFNSVRPPRTIV
jgi:hypothetical protein